MPSVFFFGGGNRESGLVVKKRKRKKTSMPQFPRFLKNKIVFKHSGIKAKKFPISPDLFWLKMLLFNGILPFVLAKNNSA